MTEIQLSHLNAVMGMRESSDAIAAAFNDQANELLPSLRSAVMAGNIVEAARQEARMAAFEEAHDILARAASKYRRAA